MKRYMCGCGFLCVRAQILSFKTDDASGDSSSVSCRKGKRYTWTLCLASVSANSAAKHSHCCHQSVKWIWPFVQSIIGFQKLAWKADTGPSYTNVLKFYWFMYVWFWENYYFFPQNWMSILPLIHKMACKWGLRWWQQFELSIVSFKGEMFALF